ncbi:MAG TPA: beta-ketoacyl-[acyl-carrier-protein] synthase family protein [Bacteriovoracaceae bacterium]|nr:beta-ketoacyl-[acyl-carrier-protein] synthase family protein [Bacteriovoracaceae bacterium]
MKHEVVITAYGIVSPLGNTPEEFEKRMFAGESGVKSIKGNLVGENFPVPYGAVIGRSDLPESEFFKTADKEKILKSWLMTAVATEQCLKNIPVDTKVDAIVYGTADGVSFELVTEVLQGGLGEDYDHRRFCCESSLDVLNSVLKSKGMSDVSVENVISVNSACASGNQTIGMAYQGISTGRWERCLVGGVDARCEPSNFLNFFLLGALTTDDVEPHKASRPFAKDRSGFVRGEGAAVLMMETRESAVKRGAKILGVVKGYGCTSDAYRLTDGRDDGSAVMQAIEEALSTAGIKKEDIDYINAHGTSTPLNDRLETLAIKKVFGAGAYKIPVSSLKSQIGHSTIASSAIEAVACLIMLQRQKVSPTINYHVPDPECDLDYVPNESRDVKLTHVLSNSFGFGGQNACIVFSKE